MGSRCFETPGLVSDIWHRHHWSWWRGTILGSLMLCWRSDRLSSIRRTLIVSQQWSRWFTFIAVIGFGAHSHLWKMVLDTSPIAIGTIGLHCGILYLAFLRYMVRWWFQRYITHWLYWKLCNVEQNFLLSIAFHELELVLAEWDAIGDQTWGLRKFCEPEDRCIEHL